MRINFSFDFISFVLGFITASILAAVLFRFRKQIAALQSSTATRAGSTRRFLTASSQGRYLNEVIRTANAAHIAGKTAKLKDIYVEPRFIRATEPYDPQAEQIHSVFHVIPVVHDLTALYAPYNVDVLTVNDLKVGERHLALLGLPGSGKSTALAILALLSAGDIDISPIDMMADEVFEEEIGAMEPAEREKAIKQRKDIQARAIAQLEQSKKKTVEEGKIERPPVDFTKLLPILVHMRDIDLRSETYGGDGKSERPLDPAEPIVKALQRRSTFITASLLPGLVYNRLNAGACLVMIDGLDDLNPDSRTEKIAWLNHFMELYGENFIIVTGPIEGYDALLKVGFAPIYLRAWADTDYEHLIERWMNAWPTIGGRGRRKAPAPDEQVVRRVLLNNRGRTPLDMTLKTWSAFAGAEGDGSRRGWYDFYVLGSLKDATLRPVIEAIAAAYCDNNGLPLKRDDLKKIVTTAIVGAEGKANAKVDDALARLGSLPLLIDWPDGSLGPRYAVIGAYLAGESLHAAEADRLKAIALAPAWNLAFEFAGAVVNLDPVVMAKFNTPPDLLLSNWFGVAGWLRDGMTTVAWRAEALKRLSATLIAPNQFPAIRDRAASALVSSRDKQLIFVLRDALKQSDAYIRQIAVVALGAIGDPEAIKDITPMLKDRNSDVQLAAGLALGAIGSDAALEAMLDGMLEGEQNLRQAVAEAFAAIPGQGYAVLRDAVAAKDMMVRHAAVFGLSRIKTAWALALLYRTLLEDDQWYVRNAAEQAFRQAEGLEGTGAIAHPEADALQWLIAWAGSKNEGVPTGPESRQMLVRALQEADAANRVAAAYSLANLGHVPGLKPLYGALRDRDEKIRAAAFKSLVEMQERLGLPLPSIN
jgi:HEAT repeat protein